MPNGYPKLNLDIVFANYIGNAIGGVSFALGLFEASNQIGAEPPYRYDYMYLMIGGAICVILGTWIKYSIPRYTQTLHDKS